MIKALFGHQFGLNVPDIDAKALHYLTGILIYPLGYWLMFRICLPLGRPASGWLWGLITYLVALGFFAPLAGLPFLLLGDANVLSLMSLIGHAVYGYVLAWVADAMECV